MKTTTEKPTTIKLKYPVTVDGAEISQITLRRPKIRDLESMDKVAGEMKKVVMLIASLAEMAPDQVRELDAEDLGSIAETLGDFLGVEDLIPSP